MINTPCIIYALIAVFSLAFGLLLARVLAARAERKPEAWMRDDVKKRPVV